MDRKTKTTLMGGLLITGGIGFFILFIFVYMLNSIRIPPPTATTTGIVIRYVPQIRNPNSSRISASCTYAYKVEGETYTINSTCGSFFEDRKG